MTFAIDPDVCHVTLLGMLNEDGSVRLPALMHFPGQGTLRITSPAVEGVSLSYDSRRRPDGQVKISLPPATRQQPTLAYRLEPTAIYPPVKGGETDARFNGYRRSWLNILQLNPRLRRLANHAASDACAFTLYEYSEIALRTPPLAENLTALDLLRQTLNRYADGMLGYGMVGYVAFDIPESPPLGPYDLLDTYPSLLISAWNYVRGSKDRQWLNQHYDTLLAWAAKMLAGDRDGNGLVEYPISGNSGIWSEELKVRPANWWDTIGFGHEDAYSNALVYRALRGMAEMAEWNGKPNDAHRFRAAADKLRSAYYPTFLNPETGVLAGWKSADGELHDYYFMMLEGIQERGFQGRGPNGMTYDWKTWDGTPHGYEGFLVDNYLVLLAVLTRKR